MIINYKNFKIYTEQGILIKYNKIFRKPFFVSSDLLRKMFLVKNKKINKKINVFKLHNSIFSFFRLYSINLYRGNNFILFNFKKNTLFYKLGMFVFTRKLDSGKNLHLRKKNLKKKK